VLYTVQGAAESEWKREELRCALQLFWRAGVCLNQWCRRICEVIGKQQPQMVWFSWRQLMGRMLIALLFATGVYFGFYREGENESLDGVVQQVAEVAEEALTDLQW
jgi:hypothetical protein